LGEYTGSLREIIHYYKFSKKSYLSEPLADLMMKILDIKNMFGNIDAIIAVPLHRKRRKERGFNQSYLVAKRLGRKLHIRVERRVLFRIKKSQPQIDLPAHQREKNVMGAFKVRKAKRIRGKRILLIDDVMTTGATVNECARVLKRSGSKEICVLTVAITPAPLKEQFPF
jgi:ComF family protein